jgi:CheY-like chemotaxis protein
VGKSDIQAAVDSNNSKYTILYVEDNAANLRLVEAMLSRRDDLTLLSATDPIQGIDIAQNRRPNLILMDINLPHMDGFTAFEQLRQEECTRRIPVIAISAYAMESDIERYRSAGFDDYLIKPFQVNRFYELLNKFVSKS